MFKTVVLARWDDIHAYARQGWLFRGQRVAAWPLKTSLERCCDRLSISPGQRRAIEDRIIREFRRAYHQFSRHVPDRDSIVEWLSIMQHHGAPTRLLDFTYSVYVGAYFAIEEADDDSVVWAIDAPWALQQAVASLRRAGRSARSMLKPFMDDDEKVVQTFFMRKPYVAAAWPINPFRLNERLRVQQGAFLVQGDIAKPFAANLAGLSRGQRAPEILKIIIPESLRHDALRRLWSMDISRASLFPGLDGFARSLGVNHSLFNPTEWTRPVHATRFGRKRRGTA